jgi:hypothetical protein
MPLVDIDLQIVDAALPGDIRSFLREAGRRIDQFQLDGHVPAFVPCDFERAYGVLRALAAADLAPGNLFCEWGSGFGVVACLAAQLDFDACGIEIEGNLVEAAQQLADDYGLPVDFAHGSFIPKGGESCLDGDSEFAWLTTETAGTHEKLGLGTDDFDVVFAYPWPDEEQATGDLFERFAAVGAVLVTYGGNAEFRLRRKKSRRVRRG